MSMRGNPSVNHHCCASSVLSLHDFDGDDGFQNMDARLLRAYVVDEQGQAWWGRVLSISLAKPPSNSVHPATVKLRVTAPCSFPIPTFPEHGLLRVTLIYPRTLRVPTEFYKEIPVQVDYVDDNGCW